MFCPACGNQNADDARFCTACGRPQSPPQTPAQSASVSPQPGTSYPQPQQSPTQPVSANLPTENSGNSPRQRPRRKAKSKGASAMRTATLIMGLIAASFLLMGGCAGFVTGSIFEGFEEAFDTEVGDSSNGITSTTEDVSGAGAFAVVVSIIVFLGAGLAKAAHKTSLAILTLSMPMLIGLVVVDTTSLFAATYYLAILLVGTGVILMFIAYVKSRNARNAPFYDDG